MPSLRAVLPLATLLATALAAPAGAQSLMDLAREFPGTDFSRSEIPFEEIQFDGARRDSIPPIHDPVFAPVDDIQDVTDMGELEPVISVSFDGVARAYPLRLMLWHEIVNDRIGDQPFVVTYCPLCNSGLVFDRRLGDRELTFGNTGRIRHFDMVMYDHQTESWWQQFGGRALIGELTGQTLKLLPARLEALRTFRDRHSDGEVLIPADPFLRPYGSSPYAGMEGRVPSRSAFPYDLPESLRMFDYVVVVGDSAWPLDRIVEEGRIEEGGVVLEATTTRNSLHDRRNIARGREISDVRVTSVEAPDTELPYDVTFAFAFSAFVPEGEWRLGPR